MRRQGPGAPWRIHGVLRSLTLTAVLVAGMLAWMPDVAANAYPESYAVPVCTGGAPATVVIDAGEVSNTTTLDLSADGGTAVGDASGGDENLATTSGDKDRKAKHGKKNKRHRDDTGDLASAGNGGVADAGASGGAIAVENVNSGGNVGSAIAVGDTVGGGYDPCGNAVGGVFIDGGSVSNETIITVSADGGTAIADASGGDRNVASAGGRAGDGGTSTSSAGNGGVATASADGGAVSIGDINSGGNAGNAIGVGDTIAGPVPVCCAPPLKPIPIVPIVPKVPTKPAPVTPGKIVVVTRLPSTGIGAVAGNAGAMMVLALAAGAAGLAVRRRMV